MTSSLRQTRSPHCLLRHQRCACALGLDVPPDVAHGRRSRRCRSSTGRVAGNATAVSGGWYFQKSAIYPGYPLEAHCPLPAYWPAHAAIAVDLPVKGLPAGPGLVYDDGLTLSMKTGAANISTVDGANETLVLVTDGMVKFNFPYRWGEDFDLHRHEGSDGEGQGGAHGRYHSGR